MLITGGSPKAPPPPIELEGTYLNCPVTGLYNIASVKPLPEGIEANICPLALILAEAVMF